MRRATISLSLVKGGEFRYVVRWEHALVIDCGVPGWTPNGKPTEYVTSEHARRAISRYLRRGRDPEGGTHGSEAT